MNYEALTQKQETLEQIRRQLKTEFFGIDNVIDEVMTAISPWYFFNELQKEPLVINLWGLTGTGKTSLVKRLSQLLQKEKAFYRFDLSEPKNNNIKRSLSYSKDQYEGDDFIICLDEFQHLRTKMEAGYEKDMDINFNLWDFLDTGEFEKSYFFSDDPEYLICAKKLKSWIANGLKIKNGFIHLKDQPEELKHTLKKHYEVKEKVSKIEYFKFYQRRAMFELLSDQFTDIVAFEQFYYRIDEQKLLNLLFELNKRKKNQQKESLSKALIFVVGNLDEAYTMSQNFNPDISADEFHQDSLNIHISHIKKALQKRFRNEQIARLGNNHIIYPALSQHSYHQIIDLHLKAASAKVENLTHIKVQFDTSVAQMIYANGVFPTQGIRPLKSTLKNHIDAHISKIITQLTKLESDINQIFISYQENELLVKYLSNDALEEFLKIPLQLSLDRIREMPNADNKILTAVHEAGHAVISISLLHDIPWQLHCSSADTDSSGFTSFQVNQNQILTRSTVVKAAARCLGGVEAERIIFGADKISMGSSSDLFKATDLIGKVVYRHGFGDKLGFFAKSNINEDFALTTSNDALETEVERILYEAQKMAREQLQREKTLLIQIADELSQKLKLNKSQIEKQIQLFSRTTDLNEIKQAQQSQPYRDKFDALKSALPQMNVVEESLVKHVKSFMYNQNNKENNGSI